MRINEYGHKFYNTEEMQEMFRAMANNKNLVSRMSQEDFNKLQILAYSDFSAPVKKKKHSFAVYTFFTWLIVIAIIGFIIYVGMTF